MPRNMRRESSVKAADCSQHDSRQPSVFSHQTHSGFLRLPLELQKTIVEYVRFLQTMLTIPRLTASRLPAYPT